MSIHSCPAPSKPLNVQHFFHKKLENTHKNEETITRDFIQLLMRPRRHSSLSRFPLEFSLSPFRFYTCDMSKSHFHVLAPLILKENTGRYVLMIVSSGHLSSVKLLSSEEVNTPSELWLFQSAGGIPHDSLQRAVTKSFMRKWFIMAMVNIVHHT